MPDNAARRATLRDVADAVGVSYQTVWRVVNDHPDVAEDTRARVLQTLVEMDYRPHRAAQVLTTGQSHMLQFILFEYGHYDRLPAVLRWAREYGYSLVVTELEGPPSFDDVRGALLETWQMVDGLIYVMPYPQLSYEQLLELSPNRPFVVMNTELSSPMPSVVTDQWAGAQQAVTHLLDLGHTRIAEIRGPAGHVDAEVWHQAWISFRRDRGLELEPALSETGDYSVYSGYEGMKRLLARGEPFTGLVAGNDDMALGAIRALNEAGLGVPDDVSVVGFDDIRGAAYFTPPLTTVRQDFDALGKESVEYLLSMIEHPGGTVHQRVLYPELIVRESTRKISS